MKKSHNKFETIIHGIFLILGLITVGFVLLITVYLVIAGIPAIREIGLFKFLFGKKWASTASTPSYGILPFILTSIWYGGSHHNRCSDRISYGCISCKGCKQKNEGSC